jgi:alkylglycerol monooxygenase
MKVVPVGLLIAALVPRWGESRHLTLVFLALSVSLIGDVAIERSFVAGLATFLVAHLLYIAALAFSANRPSAQVLVYLPAVAVFAVMLRLLAPRAGDLLVPVIVYMAVICVMLASASARAFVKGPAPSALLFFAGAAFFVVSDALIAIDRWLKPIPHAQAFILGTYYVAQGLIAASTMS